MNLLVKSPLVLFPWPSLTRTTSSRQTGEKKFFYHIFIFSHVWSIIQIFPFIKEENQALYSIPKVNVIVAHTLISPIDDQHWIPLTIKGDLGQLVMEG